MHQHAAYRGQACVHPLEGRPQIAEARALRKELIKLYKIAPRLEDVMEDTVRPRAEGDGELPPRLHLRRGEAHSDELEERRRQRRRERTLVDESLVAV